MNTTELGIYFYKVLHKTPEKSGKEYITRNIICSYLKRLPNIEIIFNNTEGIIAKLSKNSTNKFNFGFRVELDAVETADATLHHSCGHDAHMAALLAAITYISKNYKNYSDNLIFIFQSSEEFGNGAKKMVNILQQLNIVITNIFALHNAPEIEPYQIAVKSGPTLSNNVTIHFNVELSSSAHLGTTCNVTHITDIFQKINSFNSNEIRLEISKIVSDGSVSSKPTHIELILSIRSFTYGLKNLINIEKSIIYSIKDCEYVKKVSVKHLSKHYQIKNSTVLFNRLKQFSNAVFLTAPNSLSSDDFSEYHAISTNQLYYFVGSLYNDNYKYLHTKYYGINFNFFKIAISSIIFLAYNTKAR